MLHPLQDVSLNLYRGLPFWSSLLPYHVSLTSVPHVELSLPKILGAPTKDSKLGSSCTYKANTRCYSWHPLGDNGTKNIKNDPHKILERWRITLEAQTSSLLRKQKRIEPLQNEWPVPNILLLENNHPVGPEPLNLTHSGTWGVCFGNNLW